MWALISHKWQVDVKWYRTNWLWKLANVLNIQTCGISLYIFWWYYERDPNAVWSSLKYYFNRQHKIHIFFSSLYLKHNIVVFTIFFVGYSYVTRKFPYKSRTCLSCLEVPSLMFCCCVRYILSHFLSQFNVGFYSRTILKIKLFYDLKEFRGGFTNFKLN